MAVRMARCSDGCQLHFVSVLRERFGARDRLPAHFLGSLLIDGMPNHPAGYVFRQPRNWCDVPQANAGVLHESTDDVQCHSSGLL